MVYWLALSVGGRRHRCKAAPNNKRMNAGCSGQSYEVVRHSHPVTLKRYAKTVSRMPTTTEQLAFLAAASELNGRHNAVRADSEIHRLYHSFWTQSKIEQAKQMQSGWDVPKHLIPFYGDWHDLICLDTETGSVQMIDDSRPERCTWPSHNEFLLSLTTIDVEPEDTSDIIESESWLDF